MSVQRTLCMEAAPPPLILERKGHQDVANFDEGTVDGHILEFLVRTTAHISIGIKKNQTSHTYPIIDRSGLIQWRWHA